jgi:hypothetical protein
MDRATRDLFVKSTQSDLTSGNACWETPPAVFQKMQSDFGPFDIDLCADPKRHFLPVWFGPESKFGHDALSVSWKEFGLHGYCNPPYGDFAWKILRKAKLEASKGFATTLLLPLRATEAFHQNVLYGATELWFCNKRLTFWENGYPGNAPAIFDSMIVCYAPGIRFSPPRVGSWKVPPHALPPDWR